MKDIRISVRFAFAGLALCACLTSVARGAEYSLLSETTLWGFQRETALGEKLEYLPIFEGLSGGVDGVGGSSLLSLRFSGWGKADLGEPTGEGTTEGDLTSAYLQYLHPTGDLQGRAGRFFLVEGTATGYLDGVFAKAVTRPGLGLALFGGRPAETAGPGFLEGRSLAGARAFSRFRLGAGFLGEAGLGYLTEDSPSPAPRRKEIGTDLWLRVGGAVTLAGEGVYDQEGPDLAWDRLTLRLTPVPSLDLALGAERYVNARMLGRTLNPALDATVLDPADRVRVESAQVSWDAVPAVTLQGGVKRIHHLLASFGDALKGEVSARYRPGGGAGSYGLALAQVSADLAENEYDEVRGFATRSLGKTFRLALDALSRRYRQEISGSASALQVVGSVGYRWSPGLLLSGDLRYTKSPAFEKDVAGVVRVQWDMKGGTP